MFDVVSKQRQSEELGELGELTALVKDCCFLGPGKRCHLGTVSTFIEALELVVIYVLRLGVVLKNMLSRNHNYMSSRLSN